MDSNATDVSVVVDQRRATEIIKDYIREGVELRATQSILSGWFEQHGYLIGEHGVIDMGGNYRALQANPGKLGMYLEGRDSWPTYHEMLADLLVRIDAAQNGGAS